MIRNERLAIAGSLLLVASGLFGLAALRPELSAPVGLLGGLVLVGTLALAVRRPTRTVRPT